MQLATFLQRCWPEFLGILLTLLVMRWLIRVSGARLRLTHVRCLARDEVGGVQTLSFVLTIPLFIFLMMFIVQLSQLTIAKVVVEYAAFAAARSAVVWIPATTGVPHEGPNRISYRQLQGAETTGGEAIYFVGDGQTVQTASPAEWASYQNYVYGVSPGSPKFEKIRQAAAMACLSICPSRDLEQVGGQTVSDADVGQASQASWRAYQSLDQDAVQNPRIPIRLQNKVRYALANTELALEVRHKDSEPPLWILRTPWRDGWEENEIGWQDEVTVVVTHHFALLPGPGRLLARRASARPGETVEGSYANDASRDSIAQQISPRGATYTFPITATAGLPNQGHIPRHLFVNPLGVNQP